jgi:DNA-binding transcriptional LysR family regulator
MERLETRELAYFVAVAEERHFGRAAVRLGIAQPPLSRAIKQLEHRLGVRLLLRTSREVSLTPAGEVLLQEARQVLEASAAAIERTRRAAAQTPRLILASKPGIDGGLLAQILAAYEHVPEGVPVDLRSCGFREQAGLLRSGAVDVALLHGDTQDLEGLDIEELLRDPLALLVAKDHPLAARAELTLEEIENDPTPLWRADSPLDRPADLLQLISLGRAMKLAPGSVRSQLRRDLVAVPVPDAEPVPVLLAWPEQRRSQALAAFVRTAVMVAQITFVH